MIEVVVEQLMFISNFLFRQLSTSTDQSNSNKSEGRPSAGTTVESTTWGVQWVSEVQRKGTDILENYLAYFRPQYLIRETQKDIETFSFL